MAFTQIRKMKTARKLAEGMFRNKTADLHLDDLVAAIASIDSTMDKLLTDPSLNTAQSLKINLVQALPEPFKSKSSAAEKALVLSLWALEYEAGIL